MKLLDPVKLETIPKGFVKTAYLELRTSVAQLTNGHLIPVECDCVKEARNIYQSFHKSFQTIRRGRMIYVGKRQNS